MYFESQTNERDYSIKEWNSQDPKGSFIFNSRDDRKVFGSRSIGITRGVEPV